MSCVAKPGRPSLHTYTDAVISPVQMNEGTTTQASGQPVHGTVWYHVLICRVERFGT